MGQGSRYSDELKVSALAQFDIDGRVRTTARQFNIPSSTLTDWIKKRDDGELDIANAEKRIEHTKREIMSKTKNAMVLALDVVIDKIEDCNAYQAATVYGILHDKLSRMEGIETVQQGSTTNNILINNMSQDDMAKLLGRVMSRLSQSGGIEGEPEGRNKQS